MNSRAKLALICCALFAIAGYFFFNIAYKYEWNIEPFGPFDP